MIAPPGISHGFQHGVPSSSAHGTNPAGINDPITGRPTMVSKQVLGATLGTAQKQDDEPAPASPAPSPSGFPKMPFGDGTIRILWRA